MYRPVILLGNGIRNNPALISRLCSLDIPVLTTWMAADLIAENNPAFCGRPGIFGQRAANIIQQKATHLFCYGARLDGEQVAYDYDRFAPNATKFIYEIDDAEFSKFPSGWVRMDLSSEPDIPLGWLSWCKALYTRFRPELDGDPNSAQVDPFALMTALHNHSRKDDVFALGSSGSAPNSFFQSYKVKQGQRVSNVSTIGAMGADIPMALGAALATGRRTICLTGDGGFMLNTQELETIRRLHLPVIFFVFNNNGYGSIRNAQNIRFDGHHVGCDPASGLTLPKLEDIADAYRFFYVPMRNVSEMARCLDVDFPTIVEVFISPEWQQFPRVMASGNPIRTDDMENMTPYIDDLAELMK